LLAAIFTGKNQSSFFSSEAMMVISKTLISNVISIHVDYGTIEFLGTKTLVIEAFLGGKIQ